MRSLAAHRNKVVSPSLGMDASVDVQVEISRVTKAGSRNEDSVARKSVTLHLFLGEKQNVLI